MKTNFSKILKYLRVNEGITQELLSKKMGMSKSHLSLIESEKRKLSTNDFEKALNYLNSEIKIIKNGEDYMKKINKDELMKKGFKLTDGGYYKAYKSKQDKLIRVTFSELDLKVFVDRDMNNKNEFLSSKEYEYYENKYSDEEGYGKFYELYILNGDYSEMIIEYSDEKKVLIGNIGTQIFDDNTLKEIKNDFTNIIQQNII